MSDHRLSRTLGYDGMRAARKAAARGEESPAHEKKESAAFEKKEHKGYDGAAPDDEGIVSKAIRRAKEFVGGRKPAVAKKPAPKPSPTPGPNKRLKQITRQEQEAESPDAPAPSDNILGQDGKKNWIAGATKNKGGLHRSLGVPEGKKIPAGKIKAAESRGGKVGKQARLAETLKGLGHDAPEGGGTRTVSRAPAAAPMPPTAGSGPGGGTPFPGTPNLPNRGPVPPFQPPNLPVPRTPGTPPPMRGTPKLPGAGTAGPGMGAAGPMKRVGFDGEDGYSLNSQITKKGSAFDAYDGETPDKMEKTMHEFKHGELHSGSKTGPKVTNRKQAIAIGMSQARKAGQA